MNQEDSDIQLVVKLYKEADVDWLEFCVSDQKTHKLNVNLEDNQTEIKAMFCDLVELIETNPVVLNLEVAEGYDNKLLKEVAQAYVDDLNKELEGVRSDLVDKYVVDEG